MDSLAPVKFENTASDYSILLFQGGWFELNTIYSLGGESGEAAVSQVECTGEVGGTAPFASTNHIARYKSTANHIAR
jgi:hypothetical protein